MPRGRAIPTATASPTRGTSTATARSTRPAGPSPTATHAYDTSGTKNAVLRVTDPSGAASQATVAVDVQTSASPGGGNPGDAVAASARTRGRTFSARLTGVRFPSDLGAPRQRGSVTTFSGLTARGRLDAPGRRLGTLRRFRTARWVARIALAADVRRRAASLHGVALAVFPGAGSGRACVSVAMARHGDGPALGRFSVLGGTGAAARLAGGGTFDYRIRGATPTLRGRIAVRTGRPRPLPVACRRFR
jgi:hypothetical protein